MANDNNHYSDSFTLTGEVPLKQIEFQPSTIETHDQAMYTYFDNECNFHVETNKGWKKVPVIWVGAERAFQVKERKEVRDSGGMLILPLIAIERMAVTKDPARKGIMPANIRNGSDGGAITVARRIVQDKTSFNRNAATRRTWAGDQYSGDGQKYSMSDRFKTQRQDGRVVYETITMPMASRVVVEYKISIETDFQTQMNEILEAFHAKLINHKEFVIRHEGHKFYSFVEDFTFDNNLATLEEEDRVLRTTINIKVEGYLIHAGSNGENPKFIKRENAVHVAIPKEGIMVDSDNFSLTIPEQFARLSSDRSLREIRRILSVSEAKASGQVKISLDGSGGGGGVSASDVINHDDYIVQQALTGDIDGSNKTFLLVNNPRSNTLTLIWNGVILAEGADADYTISARTITLTIAPESGDRLVASYVKSS